jgi:hypothetical protein
MKRRPREWSAKGRRRELRKLVTGAAMSASASLHDVDPGEVDALIDRGYLPPKDRDDLEALAAAVTAFFSDALVTP